MVRVSLISICVLFAVTIAGCGGGSSSSGVASSTDVSGSWTGTWRSSRYNDGSYLTAAFSQTGSTFVGTVLIGGSVCFGRELASGVVISSSIDFNIGDGGREPGAPSGAARAETSTTLHSATAGGVVGIRFSATISGNQISGSYQVLSTACAGDFGTFLLNR